MECLFLQPHHHRICKCSNGRQCGAKNNCLQAFHLPVLNYIYHPIHFFKQVWLFYFDYSKFDIGSVWTLKYLDRSLITSSHSKVFCVLLSAVPVSASNGVPNLAKKVHKYMILLHNACKSIDCHYILAKCKKYSVCVLTTRTSSFKNSKNKSFLGGKCKIHGNTKF